MRMTAATATILLAACASLALGQTPKTTKVMVNTDQPDRPLIWIDQEPIIVRSRTIITWEIATAGYAFPSNGIVFQDKAQFVNCESKGRVFQCMDTRTQRGQFKYTINVRSTEKQKDPRPLDPSVMND
jgi:hypothetical protein